METSDVRFALLEFPMTSDKPQPQSGPEEPDDAYPETNISGPALPDQKTSRREPDATNQHTRDTSRDQQHTATAAAPQMNQ
eukprot:6214018-Pleurochrysis_carterae.AAC.3